MPFTGYLLKNSLQIIPRVTNLMISPLLFSASVIICLCVGSVFIGLKYCRMNDACTYMLSIKAESEFNMCLKLAVTLVGILIVSMLMTLCFYWQSRNILTKSMKAVLKVGGTRSGNSYQASFVIKLFVRTSLLPVILQLVIVIYNCLAMIDIVNIDREIQFIVTVHVIPGVVIINTACVLVRLVRTKLKQLL